MATIAPISVRTLPIAELKRRLTLGVQVWLIERNGSKCNLLRTVAHVQKNGIAFTVPETREPLWLYWKGAQAIEEPNGFRILTHQGARLRYEWMTPQKLF
jgi:hypothetical protein